MSTLPTLVRRQFKAAQESNALTFYPTKVAIVKCDELPFQVRYSPALASKPNVEKKSNQKPIDPFESPQDGLLVKHLSSSHYVVLNKFPVIPEHFILATTEFKEQTDLLEEDDIGAAYKCIKAYKDEGEELFGFFNSGEHSGASQRHRHIQFLPVKSMRSGIGETALWNVLADILTSQKNVPFTYLKRQIPRDPTPTQLHRLYTGMYEEAVKIGKTPQSQDDGLMSIVTDSAGMRQSEISYNLGITNHSMVLCPRISEGSKFETENREMSGPVAFNGTILGGALLVKSEVEWLALRSDPSKLRGILEGIGIAPNENNNQERL